jgi:hypothetical protein
LPVMGLLAYFSSRAGTCRGMPLRPWVSCGDAARTADLWGFCGAGDSSNASPLAPETPAHPISLPSGFQDPARGLP